MTNLCKERSITNSSTKRQETRWFNNKLVKHKILNL